MENNYRDKIAIGNYHYTSWSFDYFLNSVEKIGVRNIEIWGAKPHLCVEAHDISQVRELKKKIDSKGMQVICFCPEQNTYPIDISTADDSIRRYSVEHMKKAIAYGAELGARKMLLCPGNGYLNEARERIWERCRTSIIELTKTAEQYDVMLVLETQAQEDSIFMNTVWDQKEMLDQIAHPLFKAMIDTVQLAQFDSSVAENMGILGTENVRHVHLGNTIVRDKTWNESQLRKDNCLGKSVVGHIGFREGNLPLEKNIQELIKSDYQDYFTIEICQRAYFFDAHRYTEEAYARTCQALE